MMVVVLEAQRRGRTRGSCTGAGYATITPRRPGLLLFLTLALLSLLLPYFCLTFVLLSSQCDLTYTSLLRLPLNGVVVSKVRRPASSNLRRLKLRFVDLYVDVSNHLCVCTYRWCSEGVVADVSAKTAAALHLRGCYFITRSSLLLHPPHPRHPHQLGPHLPGLS